jgi:ABC-type oligopeptide transport system substrate-binding subunit
MKNLRKSFAVPSILALSAIVSLLFACGGSSPEPASNATAGAASNAPGSSSSTPADPPPAKHGGGW